MVAAVELSISKEQDNEGILEAVVVEEAVVAAVEEESVEAGTAHKCRAF